MFRLIHAVNEPASQLGNIELIEKANLNKHFQRICAILSRNTRYALMIIKSLSFVYPNKFRNTLQRLAIVCHNYALQTKRSCFAQIVSRSSRKNYHKTKSLIYLVK